MFSRIGRGWSEASFCATSEPIGENNAACKVDDNRYAVKWVEVE